MRGSKCEYRKAVVDAASLVVHGDVEVQDVATRELAEGVVFLDLELEAALIDVKAAVDAIRFPWTCSAECLAHQGYGHHEACVDNVAIFLRRQGLRPA